ncbi:MAG: LamG domain-containing protein [Archangium sp.]|nr:LamG domain-containing protein [Archangium sp.]
MRELRWLRASVALAVVAGCTGSTPSTARAFACRAVGECAEGFVCLDGFCQVPADALSPCSETTASVCAHTWSFDTEAALASTTFVDDDFAGGQRLGLTVESDSALHLGDASGCDGTSAACARRPGLADATSPFAALTPLAFSFDEPLALRDGGPSLTDGVLGNALAFDGLDDVFDGGTAFDPSGHTELTLCLWVRPRVTSPQGLAGWYDGTNGFLLQAGNPDGFNFAFAGSSHGTVRVPTVDRWTHVCAVFDGAGTTNAQRLQLYINGNTAAVDFGLVPIPPEVATLSGVQFIMGRTNTIGRQLRGDLDEVAVITRALSADEVRSVYAAQSSQPRRSGTLTSRPIAAREGTAQHSWSSLEWAALAPFGQPLADGHDGGLNEGLVGLWHLDEPAAPFLNSSGVTEPDGGLLSGRGAANNNLSPGRPALFGNGITNLPSGAACLTGIGSLTAFDFIQRTGVFSSQAWFMVNATGNGTHLTNTSYPGNSNGLVLYNSTPSNTFTGYFMSRGSALGNITAGYAMRPGRWTHVVFTGDGSVTRLYLDGTLTGTSAPFDASQLSSAPSDFPLSIGCAYTGAYGLQGGTLDEVAIWRRALSPDEVEALYLRGASRVRVSVRGCTTADCGDAPTWRSVPSTLPSLFDAVTAPWLQYRAVLESDEVEPARWPSVTSVTLGPPQYDAARPAVTFEPAVRFAAVTRFTETLGGEGCPGGVRYSLGRRRGPDTVWYWLDSTKGADCTAEGSGAWCPADGSAAHSTSAMVVSRFAPGFITATGEGELVVRAFLTSNGLTPCRLSAVRVEGLR